MGTQYLRGKFRTPLPTSTLLHYLTPAYLTSLNSHHLPFMSSNTEQYVVSSAYTSSSCFLCFDSFLYSLGKLLVNIPVSAQMPLLWLSFWYSYTTTDPPLYFLHSDNCIVISNLHACLLIRLFPHEIFFFTAHKSDVFIIQIQNVEY